tara:strand:- start:97 stop:849 length:753 start_codon:yes stop_codon:yes gene_type:complete
MNDFLYFIPDKFILLLLVITLSGFIRGFLGFASAFVTIPIISFLYSPLFAIAFNIIIEIPSTIYLTYVGIKTCKFKEVSPMFFSIILTIPIGTIFLVLINEQILKITISLLVLFFMALIASGWRLKSSITKLVLIITGAISGLMQGTAGMSGPPYATILLSKGDPDNITRGNILIMSPALVISSVISLYYFNLFNRDIILVGMVSAPIYIFATYIGSRFYNFSGNKYFRNTSLIVLTIIGVTTLITAFVQ